MIYVLQAIFNIFTEIKAIYRFVPRTPPAIGDDKDPFIGFPNSQINKKTVD